MKVNFVEFTRFVSKYRGSLYTLLFLGFVDLSFFNNYLNFSRTTSKIRDTIPVLKTASEIATLEPIKPLKTDESLATVPKTSTRYIFGSSTAKASSAFHIANVVDVADPSVDAGNGIKRFNYKGANRFLYGHSTLAFSPLKRLYVGNTFTATLDGVTKTYRVEQRVVFNKASDLDNNAARRAALYTGKYNGSSYDLALMTCGNGSNDDSNFRLVLFANAI